MQMIGSVAAAPSMAFLATSAVIGADPLPRNADWDAALSTWQRLFAAAEAAGRRLDVAIEAYDASKPSESDLQVLLRELSFSARGPYGARAFAHRFDVEFEWQRFLAGEGRQWWAPDPEARKREFRKTLEAVAAWRDADAKADKKSGFTAAAEACDAAWNEETTANVRLMKMPAPDRAAALLKLEMLFGERALADEDGQIPPWTVDYAGQFLDDVRRLLTN